jgi:hypothetical protein
MSADSSFEVALSAKALANLSRNVSEHDGLFVVGGDQYRCPSFIAAFLSPRLAELQVSDPTLHDIVIETLDPNHYFQSFSILVLVLV